MTDDAQDDDAWDEETMVDLRRFAVEQALAAHLHKRDSAVYLASVFKDADRIVGYVFGEMNP